MILKGSQRAGGRQLAVHLLRTDENEHVRVHELRGFVGEDLHSAFLEAYAVSQGTRAKQYLFSLSLNPPPSERVSVPSFEAAISAVELKLGLGGQPRAIVFHEKEGRLHAHAVWSRIDGDEMKAINLPHYKLKLRDVSRELYLEHGWKMPRGLVNSRDRNPTNFTRAEWQQAKRASQDPRQLKQMFQECWAMSDSRKAFAASLQSRGYTLACGDRRGHVAVDFRGEVYAIAKYVGVRTKDVKIRLGDPHELTPVKRAQEDIASRMTDMLRRHIQEVEAQHELQSATLAVRRSQIVQRQRDERVNLEAMQEERRNRETVERSQRFSRGFRGLWDRLTGKHGKIAQENERQSLQSKERDRAERNRVVQQQLDERRMLHKAIQLNRQVHEKEVGELHRDIASYLQIRERHPQSLRETFHGADHQKERPQLSGHERNNTPALDR